MIGSEKENWSSFQSHILHFVNFIQALFKYFNLFEIIRHFDWSPGLIRGTGPYKVENISTFYYLASNVAGSIGTQNFY
jgi:hypothetical protein